MLSPLFTCTLDGLPLRLFEAPPSLPAMPWPFDDLAECLGLTRVLRNHYLRRLPIAVGIWDSSGGAGEYWDGAGWCGRSRIVLPWQNSPQVISWRCRKSAGKLTHEIGHKIQP